jgi:hypothetical protein
VFLSKVNLNRTPLHIATIEGKDEVLEKMCVWVKKTAAKIRGVKECVVVVKRQFQ